MKIYWIREHWPKGQGFSYPFFIEGKEKRQFSIPV